MTLAAILLISIFCTASALPLEAARYHAPAPESANQSASSVGTEPQGAASPTQTPANTPQSQSAPTPATTSSGQNPPGTTKRRRRKKRAIASNCNGAPAASGQDASASPSTSAAAGGKAPTTGTSSPAANCPPSKVIVQQGGTSDPGVALAGGTTGNQASPQRDAANQMLGSTEENLKKIAGRQLSSDQQDMVNQIRQFMEQSKAAVGDGDLERARTLAWKAQVLSEELVKPAK
ncbi:MAG TPA: hypothetical protein VIH75_23725 [Candidatus Sulfotelmatobacter sp.]|jgi:hypothetical protein